MCVRIDYRNEKVWTELAHALGRSFEPSPGVSFGNVRCGPDWTWRFHQHDYDMWLVTAGRGRGYVEDAYVELAPGTLLLLRPGDIGSLSHDPSDPLSVTYTHFSFVVPGTSTPVDVAEHWLPSRYLRLGDLRAIHDPLLAVVRLLEQDEPLAALEARLVLARLLIMIYRQDAEAVGLAPKTIDPRVHAVMRHVRDRPGERPSLAEAAAVAQISPTYLRRLFRQETGISYRAFMVRSRMEKARTLLHESTMSVGEIARVLGYHDVVLFSRQVRQHFGMPASELRRRA